MIAPAPIKAPVSIRESVEQSLAALIVSGQLAPGTLVSVPTLAAQFDVSATPVREAILNLERRGFVTAVKNKGFRITEVSDEERAHLVETRKLLEPPVIGGLAKNCPHSKLPELTAIAEEIVAGAAEGDLQAYLEADLRFHLALLRLAGNPIVVDIVADLRSRTRLTGLLKLLASEQLDQSAREHLELLDLLEAGDSDGAQALMAKHIEHVRGWWAGRPEDAQG